MERQTTMPTPELHCPRYAVLIPAYQEQGRIGAVVAGCLRHVPEVFVVDDGSTDGTAAEADQAGALVQRLEHNSGKGIALETGFAFVCAHGAQVVITLDGDGQHDPAEIPKFIEAYERTGIPVLVGNRMVDVQGMPWIRRLTNRYMSWHLSRIMGQYVPDTQCGFRLYRCDLIPHVQTHSPRFAAESEILLHIAVRRIRIDSVRITTIYSGAVSKINPWRDTLRFYAMLAEYRRERRARYSRHKQAAPRPPAR
ncbi:MAG: glycosyltransferase family 2 protein [Candidatus Marinimicrobia bacterium]|nr:glycosyltransferase family 2 protein [Candidatus Neomarinimicrobiota bacterium]